MIKIATKGLKGNLIISSPLKHSFVSTGTPLNDIKCQCMHLWKMKTCILIDVFDEFDHSLSHLHSKFIFKKKYGQSNANCTTGRIILLLTDPKTATRSPKSIRETHLIHECQLWPPAIVNQMTSSFWHIFYGFFPTHVNHITKAWLKSWLNGKNMVA